MPSSAGHVSSSASSSVSSSLAPSSSLVASSSLALSSSLLVSSTLMSSSGTTPSSSSTSSHQPSSSKQNAPFYASCFCLCLYVLFSVFLAWHHICLLSHLSFLHCCWTVQNLQGKCSLRNCKKLSKTDHNWLRMMYRRDNTIQGS